MPGIQIVPLLVAMFVLEVIHWIYLFPAIAFLFAIVTLNLAINTSPIKSIKASRVIAISIAAVNGALFFAFPPLQKIGFNIEIIWYLSGLLGLVLNLIYICNKANQSLVVTPLADARVAPQL
jgi:hypothetical protein